MPTEPPAVGNNRPHSTRWRRSGLLARIKGRQPSTFTKNVVIARTD